MEVGSERKSHQALCDRMRGAADALAKETL